MARERDRQWVVFTRRTKDPKLGWLKRQLTEAGIAWMCDRESFHAPILEVEAARLNEANAILTEEIDDMNDDDPMFVDNRGAIPQRARR